MAEPAAHYRDVLVAFYQDEHHRPTADSTLNELHQHGWKIVPRAAATTLGQHERAMAEVEAALGHAESARAALRRHWTTDAALALARTLDALRRALQAES